jgi:hypothetical protein
LIIIYILIFEGELPPSQFCPPQQSIDIRKESGCGWHWKGEGSGCGEVRLILVKEHKLI